MRALDFNGAGRDVRDLSRRHAILGGVPTGRSVAARRIEAVADSGAAPLRIAFVEFNERGGLVHYTHELCNCLSEAGHDVTFVAAADMELANANRTYRLDPVFSINRSDRSLLGSRSFANRMRRAAHRGRSLVSFLHQYGNVVRQIRRQDVDYVVVGTIFRYPLMAVFLEVLARSGIRVVQICHEFENRTGAGGAVTKLLMRLNRRGYQTMYRIFFLSEHLRRAFAAEHPEIDEARLRVLPVGNGRLFEEFASPDADSVVRERVGIGGDSPYVLFYGRIREDKGVLDLVRAFPALDPEFDQCRLVLLGEAPEDLLAQLRELVSELAIEDRVVIATGYYEMEDLWSVVKNASVTVFPYRSGSQSAALQVAMYGGRPIIASRVGGLPEVIRDNENGLLFDAGDEDGLARCLNEALQPDVAAKIGSAAAESARTTHAWAVVAECLLDGLRS